MLAQAVLRYTSRLTVAATVAVCVSATLFWIAARWFPSGCASGQTASGFSRDCLEAWRVAWVVLTIVVIRDLTGRRWWSLLAPPAALAVSGVALLFAFGAALHGRGCGIFFG